MSEHDNHDSNGHQPHDTAVLDRPDAQDATAEEAPQSATPSPEADRVATPGPRNARLRRTSRRGAGHVPDDLPALLHKHLTPMGPAEAVHALDALQRLTGRASADGDHVHPAWLAQLGDELGTHRDGPAIKRLAAMLVELVPAIHAAGGSDAIAPLLGFARTQAADAKQAAADRKARRR